MISLKSARNLIMGVMVGALSLLGARVATAQIAQPPVVSAIDKNGINLADGTFQSPGADVSIGNGNSGIARIAQGATDNFSGVITSEILPTTFNGNTATDVLFYMNVSFGGTTYRFLVGHYKQGVTVGDPHFTGPYFAVGSDVMLTCTGASSDVQNHVGSCNLILPDGTVALYDKTIVSGTAFGPMQSITKPDGEVINLTYYINGSGNAMAIKSVNSSLGWMLKYEVDGSYVVTKVTAINTAVTYCDPAASSCSVPSTYPYVTSTVSGSTTTVAHNGVTTFTTVGGSSTSAFISSPNGVTKYVASGGTKVASVQLSGGSTWTYSYSTDASGNVTTTVTQPFGGGPYSLTVSYDHKIVSKTDEFNRKTSYAYNSSNQLIAVVNPDGNATTGGSTLYAYDTYNRLTETDVVAKGGASISGITPGAAIITKSHYIACDLTGLTNIKYCNKPDYTTDANGVVTTYTYYAGSGNVQTVTTPAPSGGVSAQTVNYENLITPWNYDVPGSLGVFTAAAPVWRAATAVRCMTAAPLSCNGTADARYDQMYYGSVTNPQYPNVLPYIGVLQRGDATLQQYMVYASYDSNGNLTSSYGPKGSITTTYTFYDGLNRPIGSISMDPDGAGARHRQGSLTTYDNDGHVQEVDTGPVNGTTLLDLTNMATGTTVQERNTNHFDSYGRPDIAFHYIGTSTTAKDITQRHYDAMQRVDCEANRLNQTADFPPVHTLPTSACLPGTTQADGSHDRITTFTYDPAGQVTSTVSAYATPSPRTDFTKLYDTGTPTSTGTLLYAEDANGNRTTYYYDSFDRLVATCYPSPSSAHTSSTTDCEHTTYRTAPLAGGTQAGTLVDHVNLRDNQQINFGYDAVGRLATKSGAVSESFTYDNFNQVLTHTNNTTNTSALTDTYVYNSLGWLMSDTSTLGTVGYTYDAYGKQTLLTYPGGFSIGYAYDDADELGGMSESGVTPLIGFDYDDYGRRSHLYRANSQTTTYSYDSNLRLYSIAHPFNTQSLAYNNADQIASATNTNTNLAYITSASATTNYGINHLNQIGTVNTSTSLGYDTRGNLNSDGGGGSYTYNANNLMTSATQSGITTTLTYDAENRLFSIANATYGTTKFLYDGSDLIAEYDGSNNLLHRYVHGPGDDEPLVTYDASTNKTYLHADNLGSIVGETNSSGTPTITATYSEYGLQGTSYAGRFQYTGQVWLKELGMYYYKARLYHPVLGRFMQTDPIGYGDGMNWYNYVGGDPVNGTDSTGLADGLSGGVEPGGSKGPDQPTDCHGNVGCENWANANHVNYLDKDGTPNIFGGPKSTEDFEGSNTAYWNNSGFHPDQGRADDTIAPWEVVGPGEAAGIVRGGIILLKMGVEEGIEHAPQVIAFVAKTGCFTAGTKIATPTGLKNIEDIKVGDLVLSFEVESGRTIVKPVTELIRNPPQATYEVKLKNSQGDVDTVHVTAQHPWLMASHQWEGTNELHSLDLVVSANGENLTVISVKATGKIEKIYNFTVGDTHTYLVGKNHAVVHNSCIKEIGGGMKAATEFFEGLGVKSVKEVTNSYGDKVLVGEMEDGSVATLRPRSKGTENLNGPPTVDIRSPSGSTIKNRF